MFYHEEEEDVQPPAFFGHVPAPSTVVPTQIEEEELGSDVERVCYCD
jgi:hypothetical protein